MNNLLSLFKGLLAGAAIVVVLAMFLPAQPLEPSAPLKSYPEVSSGKMSAVVRLHDVDTGRFFCSGVVISDKLIATAAHCVVEFSLFGNVAKKVSVNIRAPDGKDLGIIAKVEGAHPGADQAIVSGNFSRFASLQLVDNVKEDLSMLLDNNKLLITCGYPWGAELYCVEIYARRYYQFMVEAKSYLFPGMSGGPVIDVKTGKVVALNRAVGGENVYVSPTMGIFINTSEKKMSWVSFLLQRNR